MDKIGLNLALQRVYQAESSRMRDIDSSAQAAAGTDFSSALKNAIEHVNAGQQKAAALDKQFQLGNPNVSLEETVIASQTASLGFQTLVATRNRLVAAYNEVMNMQI